MLNRKPRVRHGSIIALHLDCGCEMRPERVVAKISKADSISGGRYSTMDNVDGKQARRTGQSSGLGELFEYELCGQH